MKMLRIVPLISLLVMLSQPIIAAESKEEKMGREIAADFEKDAKFVTDPDIQARLDKIGQDLAKVAGLKKIEASYGTSDISDFDYSFKVVDDKEINAFSLPGGRIYVCKGLIDFCKTDDELAGVLAHEVAHASHHHVMALMKKQSKMDAYIAIIAIAGGLSKMRGTDLTNIMYGAQFYRTAKMNGFGQLAEYDADLTGAIYAKEAKYDPASIIKFLDRLNLHQMENGEVHDMGIFQTHPATRSRIYRLAKSLEADGVQIDMRDIFHLCKPEVATVEVKGQKTCRVTVAGREVCTLTDTPEAPAADRAKAVSESLEAILKDGATPLSVVAQLGTGTVSCKDKTIVTLKDCDAQLTGETTEKATSRAREAVKYALWSDWVKRTQITNNAGQEQ